MKIPSSLLLSVICLPSVLLAGENGLDSDVLQRASSLKVAHAAFETSSSVAQHGTDLSSVTASAASIEAHVRRVASESSNAAMQSQNNPTSLRSSRLSQLQDSGGIDNPQSSADAGHVSE